MSFMRDIDPRIEDELNKLRSQINQSRIDLQNKQSLYDAICKDKHELELDTRELKSKLETETKRAKNAEEKLDKVQQENKEGSVREINLAQALDKSKEKVTELSSENSKLQRELSSQSSSTNSIFSSANEKEIESLKRKLSKTENECLAAQNSFSALERSSANKVKEIQDRLDEFREKAGYDQNTHKLQVAELKATHDSLKSELQSHTKEAQTLREAVTKLSSEIEENKKTIAKLEDEKRDATENLESSAGKILDLEAQIKSSINTSEHETALSQQRDAITQEFKAQEGLLTQELHRTKLELEESNKVSQQLKSDLDSTKSQLLHLQLNLEESIKKSESLQSTLAQERQMATEKENTIKSELAETVSNLKLSEEANNLLKSELTNATSNLNGENNQLKSQLEHALSNLKSSGEENVQLKSNVETMKEQLSSLSSGSDQILAEKESLKALHGKIQQQLDNKVEELNQTQQKMQQFRHVTVSQCKTLRDYFEYDSTVYQLDDDADDSIHNFMNHIVKAIETKLSIGQSKLQNTVDSLSSHIKQLEEQYGSHAGKKQVDSILISRLRQERDEARSRLNYLEVENQIFMASQSKLNINDSSSPCPQPNVVCQKESEDPCNMSIDMEGLVLDDKNNQASTKSTSHEIEIERLRSELHRAQQQLEELMKSQLEIERSKVEIQESSGQQSDTGVQVNSAENTPGKEKVDLAQEINKLQHALSSEKERYQSLMSEVQILKDELQKYSQVVQEKDDTLAEKKIEHRNMQEILQASQEKLNSLQSELELLKESQQSSTNGLRSKEEELEHLRGEESSVREALRVAERDAESRLKECQVLRGIVQEKETTIAGYEADRKEAEQLVLDFNDLASQFEQAERRIEELENTLTEKTQKYDEAIINIQQLRTQYEETKRIVSSQAEQLEKVAIEAGGINEHLERVKVLEEELKMKINEVEETDEKYLESLKENKRLALVSERLKSRAQWVKQESIKHQETIAELQKQLQTAESALQHRKTVEQQQQANVQSVSEAKNVPGNDQEVTTSSNSTNSSTTARSKKRSFPTEFEPSEKKNGQYVRAIVASSPRATRETKAPRSMLNKDRRRVKENDGLDENSIFQNRKTSSDSNARAPLAPVDVPVSNIKLKRQLSSSDNLKMKNTEPLSFNSLPMNKPPKPLGSSDTSKVLYSLNQINSKNDSSSR